MKTYVKPEILVTVITDQPICAASPVISIGDGNAGSSYDTLSKRHNADLDDEDEEEEEEVALYTVKSFNVWDD